jgi:hypothetical protein
MRCGNPHVGLQCPASNLEPIALSVPRNKPAQNKPLRQVVVALVCFLLSALLHGAVATPYLTWAAHQPPPASGEGGPNDSSVGDGLIGDGGPASAAEPLLAPPVPVNISMYVEPTAPPTPSTVPPETTPTTKTTSSASGSSGSGQTGSGTGTKEGAEDNSGVVGSPAPGKKNNCEPTEQIVKIKSHTWRVDRDLVDYYASHLRELDRQVSASAHKDDDGKTDGIIIYLPRCSLLRHGGLRNGDIIHTVNGRKVTNIANAVTTYLAVRKDRRIDVVMSRRNGKTVTQTYRLK